MASAIFPSVFAVICVITVVKADVDDKFGSFLDEVASEGKERSEVTTVAEILDRGAGVRVDDCGGKRNLMSITSTEFDWAHLQVCAYGDLSKNVSGGSLSVKMYKGSVAEGSSTGDWMKRELAWHSVPHKYEEDLCNHFGKSHSRRGCPLPAGSSELRFSLDALPSMVIAGAYKLKIRAIDAAGKSIACLRVHADVPRGKSGELFRRVTGLPMVHARPAEGCFCVSSDPICGYDGQTYGSACHARCANVDVAYPGKCGNEVARDERVLTAIPAPDPDCADVGSSAVVLVNGICPAWVSNGNHCGKEWATAACAETCGTCQSCTLGAWGTWSACSSTCGGGGQYRTRDPGTCGEDHAITDHRQCETQSCDPGSCTLSPSPPLLITEDNAVVEEISILTSGKEAAIFVLGAANVILRNIKVVHTGSERVTGWDATLGIWMDESGAGIFFRNSPNITIENVHVALVRPTPNPYASDGVCASEYCGPFPYDMKYAYNIYGQDSDSPTLFNVYVTGGSTGFWCTNCPYGTVSHFKAENMHGPFPRGQCFQVVQSTGFTFEDFTCIQDNQIAFPEDDVSIWDSSYAVVRRGLIQGGNAPNGVGIMFEMSNHAICEDVDVTLVGGACFSAYGSDNVTWLRTRARDNHADGTCLAAHGYCKDFNGLWPNSERYASNQSVPDKTCCGDEALERCDTKGIIWFAGDYTSDQAGGAYDDMASNISIQQGVFHNMTAIESSESYSVVGTCVDIDIHYWSASAASRQEAYINKVYAEEDFGLRLPFHPTFCFPVDETVPTGPTSTPMPDAEEEDFLTSTVTPQMSTTLTAEEEEEEEGEEEEEEDITILDCAACADDNRDCVAEENDMYEGMCDEGYVVSEGCHCSEECPNGSFACFYEGDVAAGAWAFGPAFMTLLIVIVILQ